MDESDLGPERRRELAARAAWLWYVKGDTQEEVARQLGISRAAAQRLVAQALSERLVSVRIDHPVASCMRLADQLAERFGLASVDVVPDAGLRAIAGAAAARLAGIVASRAPAIIAVGNGRTVKAVIAELPVLERPQHRIVGMVGATAQNGSANPYEVVVRLADRLGAQCWPMPAPLLVDRAEERLLWQGQRLWRTLAELADRATLGLVGIGHIGAGAPMAQDGFVETVEMADLAAKGGRGEILGWVYDERGRLLDHPHNARVTSVAVPRPHPTIAVAAGPNKVEAIRAALRGRLVDRLVTNEPTALELCETA